MDRKLKSFTPRHIFVVLTVTFYLAFQWPTSFSHFVERDRLVIVNASDISVNRTKNYILNNSQKRDELYQILNDYQYSRVLFSVSGSEKTVMIHMQTNRNNKWTLHNIEVESDDDVVVNGKTYRVKGKKGRKLYARVKAFLEEQEDSIQ